MSEGCLRIVASVAIVLFGASCVPPSCFDLTYGFPSPDDKALVDLTVYSEPIEGAIGPSMWHRFSSGANVTMHASGRMSVSRLDMWPRQCPTVPQQDLLEIAKIWEPVLRQTGTSEAHLDLLASPFTGMDDWQAEGPLVEFALQSPSGKTVQLLWDGSPLPESLDAPLMRTLEIVCSNSRLARGYLQRNLPGQVSSRLDCRR